MPKHRLFFWVRRVVMVVFSEIFFQKNPYEKPQPLNTQPKLGLEFWIKETPIENPKKNFILFYT